MGTLKTAIKNKFDKLMYNKAHISVLGRSVDTMRKTCRKYKTQEPPFDDWFVEFLIEKASHLRDRKGSKKWVLVAWTPVWLPGDYVLQHYSEFIKQFNAQQKRDKEDKGRDQRLAKRKKGKFFLLMVPLNIKV